MSALVVVESVVLALLGVLVVGLLRSHADILRRLHALDGGEADGSNGAPTPFRLHLGVPAPRDGDGPVPAAVDIAGRGIADDLISIRIAGTTRPVLLAFLSSSCMTCRPFWDAFRSPDRLGLPAGARVVVVAMDAEDESVTRLTELSAGVTTVVMSGEAWQTYGVPGSPYFVWIDDGRVRGEGTGISWEQVRNLLVDAAASNARRSRVEGLAMEARIDDELQAAGVAPSDPSLRPRRPGTTR